ncbi:MAG: hypothetical protein RIB32_03215 [Phycisphaerales bacterium]
MVFGLIALLALASGASVAFIAASCRDAPSWRCVHLPVLAALPGATAIVITAVTRAASPEHHVPALRPALEAPMWTPAIVAILALLLGRRRLLSPGPSCVWLLAAAAAVAMTLGDRLTYIDGQLLIVAMLALLWLAAARATTADPSIPTPSAMAAPVAYLLAAGMGIAIERLVHAGGAGASMSLLLCGVLALTLLSLPLRSRSAESPVLDAAALMAPVALGLGPGLAATALGVRRAIEAAVATPDTPVFAVASVLRFESPGLIGLSEQFGHAAAACALTLAIVAATPTLERSPHLGRVFGVLFLVAAAIAFVGWV